MRVGITCTIQGQIARPAGAGADWDEEFDKPETVEAIAAILRGLGHDVEVLGDGPSLLRHLLDDPPDFVFNFAEGAGASRSREARVPAVLEMLDIPYSGSDPLTLAVTLDKPCAKRLVRSAGVSTPAWLQVDAAPPGVLTTGSRPGNVLEQMEAVGIAFPAILKPAHEGSSKGVSASSLVRSADELIPVLAERKRNYRQPILIEEFIAGDEATVGILGNDPPRVVGTMRILPTEPTTHFVYTMDVKREWRRWVCYEAPAQLPAHVIANLEEAALISFRALGCRDVARIDFRLRGSEPYFLEANPLPGLHPDNSDLVLLARGYGMSHAELVAAIFEAACTRGQFASTAPKPQVFRA